MSETAEERISGWRRFWRGVGLFILWLIRLILALGLGVVLGVAVYYVAAVAVPWFYSQVLSPIQVNSVKVDFLETDIQRIRADVGTDIRSTWNQISGLQKTINEQTVLIHTLQAQLEAERSNRQQILDVLQAELKRTGEMAQLHGVSLGQLETASKDNDAKLSAGLEVANSKIVTVTAEVAKVAESVSALAKVQEDDAKKVGDGIKALESSIASVKGSMATMKDSLGVLSSEVVSISQVITMPIKLSDAFERRLVLMQAWQEILKARLHLLEKNAGYASRSLALAKANVDRFKSLSTDLKAEQLAPIVERVEKAGPLIETDPFVAVQELEIIWHELEKLISPPVAAEASTGG